MRVLEGSISRRPPGRQELAARHTFRAGNPLSANSGQAMCDIFFRKPGILASLSGGDLGWNLEDLRRS